MTDRTEVAGINTFRAVTGLVGFVLFWVIAIAMTLHRVDLSPNPFLLILTMTATAGWGALFYACRIRSSRITGTALAFVLALGVCGMSISYLALGFFADPLVALMFIIVMLIGTWILNGLGIVWIVQKVRRIRAVANTDEEDAVR